MRYGIIPLTLLLALATSCDLVRGAVKVGAPAAQAALEPLDITVSADGGGAIYLDARTVVIEHAADARITFSWGGVKLWAVCKGADCAVDDALASGHLYYRIATGQATETGAEWVQLQAITCAEAALTLPALAACPDRGMGPKQPANPTSEILYIPPPPPPTKE